MSSKTGYFGIIFLLTVSLWLIYIRSIYAAVTENEYIVSVQVATPLNCPNQCSGHGECSDVGDNIQCVCNYGYTSPDCSARVCPGGVAWTDYASANDVAHASGVECSNMVMVFTYINKSNVLIAMIFIGWL